MSSPQTANTPANKVKNISQEQPQHEDLAIQMHFGNMTSPHNEAQQDLLLKKPLDKLVHPQPGMYSRQAPQQMPFMGYHAYPYHGQPMYMVPASQDTYGSYYPFHYMAQHPSHYGPYNQYHPTNHIGVQGVSNVGTPTKIRAKTEQTEVVDPKQTPVIIETVAPEVSTFNSPTSSSIKNEVVLQKELGAVPANVVAHQRISNFPYPGQNCNYPSAVVRRDYQKRRMNPYESIHPMMSPYRAYHCAYPYQQLPTKYYEHPQQEENETMEPEEPGRNAQEEANSQPTQQYFNIVHDTPVHRRVAPVFNLVNSSTASSAQRFQSRARRQQKSFAAVPDINVSPLMHALSLKANDYRERKLAGLGPKIEVQTQVGAANTKNFNVKECENIVIPLYRPNMNTVISLTVSGFAVSEIEHTTLVLQILIAGPNYNTYCWKDVISETPLFQDRIPVESCEIHASGGKLTMYAKENCTQMKVKFQLVDISCKSRSGCMSTFGPVYRILACHDLRSGVQIVEECNCVFGIINTGKYQVYQEKYTALIARLIGSPNLVQQILEEKDEGESIKEAVTLLLNMLERATDENQTPPIVIE